MKGNREDHKTSMRSLKAGEGESETFPEERSEEKILLQNQLLEAITRAHERCITNTHIQEAFATLLSDLLKLTRSEYGFIGEVLYTPQGRPYLKTHAITNISWDETTRTFYERYAPEGMEFHNLQTLFGAVMTSGEPVIANDPSRDPRRGGTPEGHPPLHAFLGLPMKVGEKLVAIAGVANRPGGYDPTQIDFLEPLLKTIGLLIEAKRSRTEKERAEETLKLSEEKIFKAFQASPAWLVISSLEEGRYLEVNDAFLKSTGFSREEVIGRSSLELNIWANPEERAHLISELKEKGSLRNKEVKLRKKSGEPIDVLLSAEVIEIEGRKYMLSASLDITERKRAEQMLKASEERYRTLVEGSMDAIAFLDPERRILSCNQAFCDLFGYRREEVEGKSIRIVHRSDESFRSFGELAYSIVKEKGNFRGEWNFVRKDSTEVPTEVSLSPIRSPKGEIAGYVSISRDITERKRAEKEIASLQEQFLQAQKMEAVGRLAGGVAHDFNNILTVIKGCAQLSLLTLREEDPLYGNLKEIERSAERAADLTRQLLAFSRKQVLEPKVLDLNGIIRNLDKMLRRLLGEDIELITFLGEDLGRVKVDPGQMEQVIINLAVNARDAMPKGGKLTIETADVELDEGYARRHISVTPGFYVMLSISDTGVGMTPEVKDHLFEPFFTTKERGKGTGLGLSTVYGIVKQSGGNIWVYSEPGQGTTFKIYLPRVEEFLEELKEEVLEGIPRGIETILVIEDEEVVRKLAVQLLKKQGYHVLEAPDGGKALMLCETYQEPIHLILSDVVMPGVSGREVVERLQKIHPEAKSLYMSGYTENVILHHGILEKGVEFIQKPFSLESLARKVREVLDKT